jgi:hypothetical protein
LAGNYGCPPFLFPVLFPSLICCTSRRQIFQDGGRFPRLKRLRNALRPIRGGCCQRSPPASISMNLEDSSDIYSPEDSPGNCMKSGLSILFLLLFAASAEAQRSRSFSSASSINQGGGYSGGYSGGWDGYGAGGYGYGTGGSHHHGGGLHYEAPREFSTGYVTNDGPYVPSIFMNYNEALALGKQQLAAAANPAPTDPGPSLGDVARAHRTARNPTQASPTLALQDSSGRLQICSRNGDNCRQL